MAVLKIIRNCFIILMFFVYGIDKKNMELTILSIMLIFSDILPKEANNKQYI